MQIETTNGSVTFSRASGEQLLRAFSARWSMPVVALSPVSESDASYGVVFQVGDEEAWCFLHLLPPERGSDVEIVLSLLERAMGEALCRLSEWRPPGVLLPCACLVDNEDGTMTAGMALFTSEALGPDIAEPAHSELANAFVDVMATTRSGALLPPFRRMQRVPRLAAGAIKFDTALVDGAPLSFRVQPEDPVDRDELAEMATVWAAERIKHIAWAPAIPIFLSDEEAAALEPNRSDAGQDPLASPQHPAFAATELAPGDVDDVAPPQAEAAPADLSAATPNMGARAAGTARGPSMHVPRMAPVPSGATRSESAPPKANEDPDVLWGPTVLDIASSLRNTSERETLVRLRGETIGNDAIADDAARQAVAVADAQLAGREANATEEPVPETLPPLASAADRVVLPQRSAEQPLRATQVGAGARRGGGPVSAPVTASGSAAAPSSGIFDETDPQPVGSVWDVPTLDAVGSSTRAHDHARTTAGYAPSDVRVQAEVTAEFAQPNHEAGTLHDGPAALTALSASLWASLHDHAGDSAHTAVLCAVLRSKAAAGHQTWLPPYDEVARDGEQLHLLAAGDVVMLLSVRLATDLDSTELARAAHEAGGAPGVVLTLEKVADGLLPDGWHSRSLDELVALVSQSDPDPVADEYIRVMGAFADARAAFAHDTLADASDWAEALGESPFSGSLLQSLHRLVVGHAIGGLQRHGWPRLSAADVVAGRAPTQRVYDAAVRVQGGGLTSEVAILDPSSPHVYGVRASGGRVLIFAEGFDMRATAMDASLAWGRRNEFLRDVAGLLHIDPKFIEGDATDHSRSLEIDTYQLLRADSRATLIQTLVETSFVLWQRTHKGRFGSRA